MSIRAEWGEFSALNDGGVGVLESAHVGNQANQVDVYHTPPTPSLEGILRCTQRPYVTLFNQNR